MYLWEFFSKKMTTTFLTDFLLLLQTPIGAQLLPLLW